jgi:HPr kinase/phosphorylase
MKSIRTVQELVNALSVELEITWDGRGAENPIYDDRHDPEVGKPSGPLNLIRPNQVQIIGPPEHSHLSSGEVANDKKNLQQLFQNPPVALLFTNSLEPSPDCQKLALASNTAIITTDRPDYLVIDRLYERFSQTTGETLLVHGVFMEVLGKGVLLSGDPAIGKSELALALISRGHRLIADDAAELYKTHHHTIMGRCPKVLQDFLEVRGLGLINIRAMFGNSAIKPDKRLHLIIDLVKFDDERLNNMDRLEGCHSLRKLLDVEIPQTSLPVAAGRNLAILVETAVRQHMLSIDGYSAAKDFIQRQQNHIDQHPKKGD